jgi:hypothetical protein
MNMKRLLSTVKSGVVYEKDVIARRKIIKL